MVYSTPSANPGSTRKETSRDDRIAIKTLCDAGFSNSKVASKMKHLSRATVNRICKKYRDTNSIEFSKRGGRSRKTSQIQDALIREVAVENRFLGTRRLQPILREKFNIDISSRTIRRRLSESNIKMKRCYKVPLLTESHKRQRMLFAIKHRRKDWSKVIFSDEKKMQLFRQNGTMRVLPHEHPMIAAPKKSPAVMYWACFTAQGVSNLIECEGRINGAAYKKILEKGLLPYYRQLGRGRYTFLHDGAPPHRPKFIRDFISENKMLLIKWPPNSPDLNLIENLWSVLEQRVWERNPKGMVELKQYSEEEWKSIPLSVLKNLVNSMKIRVRTVIYLKGATIPRSTTGPIKHKFPTVNK